MSKGKTEPRVRYLLKNHPKTRNSDKELIIQYLQYAGAELSPKQIAIIQATVFESVTRCRRKIQEGGEYPADKSIAKEREYKAQRVQQIAPAAKPQYIADTIEETQPLKQQGMF